MAGEYVMHLEASNERLRARVAELEGERDEWQARAVGLFWMANPKATIAEVIEWRDKARQALGGSDGR
jgi:hypothetical protein